MPSRPHTVNLTVGAAALLLSLLAIDLGIRLTLPVPTRGYGAWAGYPGSRLTLESSPDNFAAVHRYNRFGFRGADFRIEREAKYRIACVGDSYTEGVGAREEETWPARLQARLRNRDAEVLNLGDAGSDPERYSRIVHDVALPLGPTDVILCWLPSDLRNGPEVASDLESFPRLGDPFRQDRTWSKPLARFLPGWTYLVERAGGRWPVQKGSYWTPYEDTATEGAVSWLAENQQIPREEAEAAVRRRLHEIAPEVLRASRRGEFNPTAVAVELIRPFNVYRVRTSDMRVGPEVLRAKTSAWFEWFARTCREADVRPWVLYFPPPPLVMDGPWGPFSDPVYENRPRVVGDTSVRDLLAEVTGALGVPFIDLTGTLRAHRGEDLFLRYDTHPNARAYELAAGAVAQRLQRALP